MAKLASARDFRTYGPGFYRNRYEYINAGLYLFATVVLACGFVAQLSSEPRSGLVLLLLAFALIIVVNVHDLLGHLAGIDFRFSLTEFDLQLAFVEFAVPVIQSLGSLVSFLGILFLFVQEKKGYGYCKLEKHALNMLVAGPVLWLLGSIQNSCQIYERADGHVQILQQGVNIPFLMASLSFMLCALLNYYEQYGQFHHGLRLLGKTWIWLGIIGSILLFIGGLVNLVKVFKMEQLDGLIRLEKLRGGAHGLLMNEREGQFPLILKDQMRTNPQVQDTILVPRPSPTLYKDVLLANT